MVKNRKTLLLLILVVALAFLLRFYRITEDPPSLNWDEVSIGYNAYSILKTGHDEWGKFMPVHFKAFGEYKLPAQIYASIPGIAIFGLNALGVRITPVVYGTLTILLMFFLARKLFKSDGIGLLSAFLLAISPWHIQLTRASFESSFSVFWVVMGIWLLIKGFEEKKWLVISMIPFAVSVYTYNTTRVFTPIFLFVVLIIYRKELLVYKKAIALCLVIFILFMVPFAQFLLSGEGGSRYKLVSVTDDPGLVPRIEQNRNNSTLPQPLPRLVNNKITYVSFYIAEHYLAHFTPQFLFISGAPHKQHHVQGIGELYWFQAPFLFLGLYLLFKKKRKFRWLLVAWLLLSFIPVSVTNDSIPHALRTLVAVPVYQILTALGMFEFYLWFKNRYPRYNLPFWLLISVIVVVSLGYYLYRFYVIYPVLYSRDWQYGYQQAVDYVNKQVDNYDIVIFTRHYGEPHIFTLFFLKFDPYKYQHDPNLVRYETNDWVWVLRFSKYYFPDLGDPGTGYKDIVAENPGKKLLFIGKPGDFPPEAKILKTVNFLNGQPDFEITEVK